MKSISDYRQEIDAIDDEIASLIEKRMGISSAIGKLKKKEGKQINDESREDEIVIRIADGKENGWAIAEIYQTIFKVSKEAQE